MNQPESALEDALHRIAALAKFALAKAVGWQGADIVAQIARVADGSTKTVPTRVFASTPLGMSRILYDISSALPVEKATLHLTGGHVVEIECLGESNVAEALGEASPTKG